MDLSPNTNPNTIPGLTADGHLLLRIWGELVAIRELLEVVALAPPVPAPVAAALADEALMEHVAEALAEESADQVRQFAAPDATPVLSDEVLTEAEQALSGQAMDALARGETEAAIANVAAAAKAGLIREERKAKRR